MILNSPISGSTIFFLNPGGSGPLQYIFATSMGFLLFRRWMNLKENGINNIKINIKTSVALHLISTLKRILITLHLL